jgi:hypothetical protein
MTINRTLADLSVADQATAEAGTNNTEYMTPLRAKQSIVANSTPSGTKDFVASGTLPDGSTVILNSDGTVSNVTGVVEGAGTATVFESASSYYISVASISATQVVIAYQDAGNSSYGTAIVGTISGTSISFGTATVFESANSNSFSVTPISETKVVIAYGDAGNSQYGTAIVGTVSGTSISFGTVAVFESANSQYISVTSISSTQVVIGYTDVGNSNYGTAIVGTISGTYISFGTPVVFESATSTYISVTSISSTQVVIAYRDDGNSYYGTAIVGTVSGTSISFGTATVFESAFSIYFSVTSISSTQVVIAYRDDGNSYYGTAIVGTVSGTSISFGTATVFESANSNYISVASISATQVVIAYTDAGNSNYGTAITYNLPYTNSENFIGITAEAIADEATGTVTLLGGVSSNQSGLTIGADYYVDDDGTLTATANSIPAGKAVSATELLITGGGA